MLAGIEDDAGVYQISDDTAIVQTADFFTPIVDIPYDFGAIAAANALSDVYAMGARPLTALNLVAFPKNGPIEILNEILRGGADKIQEAGASIIGGHSIDDQEPKYGMAVMGIVHPDRIIRKGGAKAGDLLVLTKPLGIGIISTAIKTNKAPHEVIAAATQSMKTLNKSASEAMIEVGISGATDITGFGLLGHLHEMLHQSNTGARLQFHAIPFIPGTKELASCCIPGGTRGNLKHLNDCVLWNEAITEQEKYMLADAQTSGGLLIAVPSERLESLLRALSERGVATRAVIGEVIQDEQGKIVVDL